MCVFIDGASLILFERAAPKIKNEDNPIPWRRIGNPQRAGDLPGIPVQLAVWPGSESGLPSLYLVLLPPGLCQERRLSSVSFPLALSLSPPSEERADPHPHQQMQPWPWAPTLPLPPPPPRLGNPVWSQQGSPKAGKCAFLTQKLESS